MERIIISDMSKLEILIIGYLDLCADKNGTEYPESDWRAEYLHKPGLIGIFASEHKAPGKMFAHFFPYDPDSPFHALLRLHTKQYASGTAVPGRRWNAAELWNRQPIYRNGRILQPGTDTAEECQRGFDSD